MTTTVTPIRREAQRKEPKKQRKQRARALEGERAIVTGAARGIGRGIAVELARQGANVTIADLESTIPAMENACEAIQRMGGKASYVVMDVSDLDGMRHAVDAVVATKGGVDILVNNAGIAHVGAFAKQDPASIAKLVQINLTGTMVLTRLVLPGMLERGRGRIAFVASIQGVAGTPGFVTYSATKGGMIRFAEALEREVGSHGIRVTTVLPPAVKTEAFARAKAEAPKMMSWGLFPPVPIEQVASRAVRGIVLKQPRVYAGAQSALAAAANRVSQSLMGFILRSSFHEPAA